MYPVSEEYLEAIAQRSVITDWYGTIRAVNGVVYEITPAVIVENKAKLTRQICASDKNLEIGKTCSSELSLALYLENVSRYELMDATVRMEFRIQLPDRRWEVVPLGIFTVDEPPSRSMDVITITANDYMMKFNKNFGRTVQGLPYSILLSACEDCGVELGTTQEEIANYPNGQIETYNLSDVQIYTYRDLIGQMAAYLCCYAYVGVDGRLYLAPYSMEPDRTITEDWRFEYKPKDYEAYYTSIEAYFAITQEYEQVILSTDGLEYNLGSNAFNQFNDNDVRRAVLTNIITKLAEISYTPFSGKFPCDPSIMPGDVLNFTGNHAVDGKLACVTKQIIKIGGQMELSCGGDDPNLNVLTEREKQLQSAAKNSNKDGMYYYDYVNVEDIEIGDGKTATIILFNYVTTKETHIDFHAELKCQVETTESYDEGSDTYTEHDASLQITYRSGGDTVTEYFPADSEFDGIKLNHLMYTWWASGNIVSSFEVLLKCTGCSVFIEKGASRGYLAGVGLVGDVSWDGSVYIYDEFPPIDFGIIRKDYESEVEITKATPTESGPADSLTRRNFARTILKGLRGSVTAHNLHRFTVLWNDNEVTKTGVHSDGSYWVNDDQSVDGILTTPPKEVSTILTVTSHHSEQNGDVTYLASFDQGESWYSYSGGWAPWESGHGMAEPVMNAITQAEWNSKLEGTITMRAILEGDTKVYDIQIYTEEVTE